jgi:hypothetical protein
MKKTRRIVRKRKQKGGIKPATLLTVLAAYVLSENGKQVTAESIKAQTETLEKNKTVVDNLEKNDIKGAIEAIPTFSDKVLELAKTVQETDSAIYKGISDWFFQKAQEIESQKSLAPLIGFMSYDTEGPWVGDEPPTPTPPPPSLEEGKRYTVSGTIPEESRDIVDGSKVIFQRKYTDKGGDSYYIVTRESDTDEIEHFLPVQDVTLTPINNGGRKTRRKNVRRKK